MPPTRDPFGLVGQIVDSQFEVESLVGEGGFSVVYRAKHLGLGVPVALKCLRLPHQLTPELIDQFTRRFRDESRIAYRLSQGNLDILRCITAGTTYSQSTNAFIPFMALEWLEGFSLSEELRYRRSQRFTGRPLEDVLQILDPAANALGYAHAQSVVHRDVKPGNFFVAQTPYGKRLKVVDFGIAKILDPEAIGITPGVQTVGHFAICSPSYAAPEQLDSRTGPIGPWTDVYALAMVILEMLRDKKVRTGDNLMACTMEALDTSNLPTAHNLGIRVRPRVELVLARAVAVDVRTRPQTIGEFWDELRKAAKAPATSLAGPDAGLDTVADDVALASTASPDKAFGPGEAPVVNVRTPPPAASFSSQAPPAMDVSPAPPGAAPAFGPKGTFFMAERPKLPIELVPPAAGRPAGDLPKTLQMENAPRPPSPNASTRPASAPPPPYVPKGPPFTPEPGPAFVPSQRPMASHPPTTTPPVSLPGVRKGPMIVIMVVFGLLAFGVVGTAAWFVLGAMRASGR